MYSIYPCEMPQTIADKSWSYSEYYIGERDEDMRKDGYGRHHWSGAPSLENYEGQFVRNTMHGIGEYRCRYRGSQHKALTYEGHFYNNCMHGYGTMSYTDGRVFSGVYYNNLRWGPGIESYACLCENVGLWKGTQLVRLSWKPPTASVVPDLLSSSKGRSIAAQNRTIFVTNTKVIGEANPDLALLRKHGATPHEAIQKLNKLYPRNCTDRKSQLYHTDVFDRSYYDTTIETLEIIKNTSRKEDEDKDDYHGNNSTVTLETSKFYAWNNNEMIIHMMKHCYQHYKQRSRDRLYLEEILNGPRLCYKPAAQHELNCRTLLMTCYLGHIKYVAQLINENDVDPNITDIQGNSATMYAACGNHPNIIHFLVEAGAHIDDCNDACCTPLGAALVNYVCAYWDIPFNNVLDAILPSSDVTTSFPGMERLIISEWKIERDLVNPSKKTSYNKTLKSIQTPTAKKTKSYDSLKTNKISISKETKCNGVSQDGYEDLLTEEKQLYLNIVNEYNNVVNELYCNTSGKTSVRYLFEVFDMVAEIDAVYTTEDQKKLPEKKHMKSISKIIKDTVKPNREIVSSGLEKKSFLDNKENIRNEQLEKVLLTIKQLLLDGAKPSRSRCPQPALHFAISSYNPVLVRELVERGADVNEVYSESFGYSPLEIAVSGPLTKENLDVILILLENGAKANDTLTINRVIPEETDTNTQEFSGPTLLHAVLSKKVDNEADQDICHQLLDLLLKYGCDPIIQYKGRSAMDLAISKQVDIFDIFIENPCTNLNDVINNSNQTILVKMFYLPYCKTIPVEERMQTLTKLLKFGADPLLKCQNEDQTYDNLFVYINIFLSRTDKPKSMSTRPPKQESKNAKSVIKSKKTEKPKTVAQSTIKSGTKAAAADEISDYKQTVDLLTNCTRLLLKRWIQAQLMKELIQVVDKYKHRHWNMILKEYKNGTCSSLWLNPIRCLEIWDILKTTKQRLYNEKRVLKHVLCMVLYYLKKKDNILQEPKVSSDEKASIETEIAHLVREHITRMRPQDFKRLYATPELTPNSEISKFKICFECAMPIIEVKIPCGLCNRVDFCSFECMTASIERFNCHPCSVYLKKHITVRSTSKSSTEIV